MLNESDIKTTGNLRSLLADAANSVVSGDMDIDRATALHKLAKNISDSLYSEAKIKIMQVDNNEPHLPLGSLRLGDADEATE